MKSVYDEYIHLWPEESRNVLKPLLKTVEVLAFPREISQINTVSKPSDTIIVTEKGGVKESMTLMGLGFQHCVQASRPDFAQELLASAVMIIRPQAFHKDPIPFFLTGFSSKMTTTASDTKMSIQLPVKRNSDKTQRLQQLADFLNTNSKVASIHDIVIQVADEMLSNALFSAPRDSNGHACYHDVDRRTDVIMPGGMEVNLFACFTGDRVILGCEDKFGSLERKRLMGHLQFVFNNSMVAPNEARAGAGLGIRYMIENSANFYVFTEKEKRTLVICGFLLKGLKANLMADRHMHFSVV